jgi:hypothetical protein
VLSAGRLDAGEDAHPHRVLMRAHLDELTIQ